MRWLERLDSLSYRIKMPVSFAAAAVVAAFVVALGLTCAAYLDSEEALASRSTRVAQTTAKALPGLMLKDELWSSFELVKSIAGAEDGGVAIVVVDSANRVFVSNDPHKFPVGSAFASRAGVASGSSLPEAIWREAPVLSNDDDPIGAVFVGIVRPGMLHEFFARARSVGKWTLIALAFLLPLGWYAGNRMAKPLVRLADALREVASNPGSTTALPEHPSKDELGMVTRRFNEMSRQLAESETVKKEVYRAERLAAVGRLAGGVAHEINNPLAGLLNAINTQRRHGSRDAALSARTLDLLERGLNQIRQTVAALLVEVRPGDDALTTSDFEDLMTLIEPSRAGKDVTVEMQLDMAGPVSLPSSHVRQVALNLLLNAIDATPKAGKVRIDATSSNGEFRLRVRDEGPGLSDDALDHLFAASSSSAHAGEGLGLWVTKQLVQDLNGRIRVYRLDDTTAFDVSIPIMKGGHDAAHLPH